MKHRLRTPDTARLARPRPTRAELEPAALDLIRHDGAAVLATARRYSLTPEDADDAYQRGLEILLTKAPTTDRNDLLPWLKTVVKHEAFAVRRGRERAGMPPDEPFDELGAPSLAPTPAEQAERYERLRHGAEAIQRLKPQEMRCLLLRAEGYSYRQICDATGWTYTKVNRCLTEGRRRFLSQVQGIEAGAECGRLEPLLSAMADGEATPQQMLTLRPHLRSCLTCRATLREFRSVPVSVTALAGPLALAPSPADLPGAAARGYEAAVSWLHERGLLLGMKAQQAFEMASAGKVAAVAASTVAIGGGGIATVNSLDRGEREPPRKAQREARAVAEPPRADFVEPAPPKRERRSRPRHEQIVAPAPAPAPVREPRAGPEATVANQASPPRAARTQQPATAPTTGGGEQESQPGKESAPADTRPRSPENGGYGL